MPGGARVARPHPIKAVEARDLHVEGAVGGEVRVELSLCAADGEDAVFTAQAPMEARQQHRSSAGAFEPRWPTVEGRGEDRSEEADDEPRAARGRLPRQEQTRPTAQGPEHGRRTAGRVVPVLFGRLGERGTLRVG